MHTFTEFMKYFVCHSRVLLCFLLLSVPCSAAVKLKLSHNQDRTTPVHQAMVFMGERLKTLSQGEILLRIYPNGQLGTQRESMELMQLGAIDMVKSNASEMEAFSPAYSAFNLPYIFRDREHYYQVLQSQVGEDILNSSEQSGFMGITYYDGGSRSFYASKPIKSPADLKGLKIRVQPSPTAIRMIELMGGAPTPLAYGELYTALQQGVVDGAENNIFALTRARHGEVAKVYSYDEHTMIPDVLVISTQAWRKLSDKQQALVKTAAKESMLHMKVLWQKEVDKALEEAKLMGVEFVDVDKQAFSQAVEPMHDEALKKPEIAPFVKGIKAL